jgi:hypothetical protein
MNDFGLVSGRDLATRVPFLVAVIFVFLAFVGMQTVLKRMEQLRYGCA